MKRLWQCSAVCVLITSGWAAERGAEGWAFRPIRETKPPQVEGEWGAHPIDAFVCDRLRREGLEPAPPAAELTLLRRASFDLTGLPPSQETVKEWLSSEVKGEGFDRLLDRLLELPQYGERWGRHWLDVVRYADSGGFETDPFYRTAWKYRDYVIRSLNADKRFDRFIREQVAGDELWPEDADAVVATAMYSIGPVMVESAMISGQLEYEWLTDAVDTTGAAFLGLTLGCARCHDHKYDPITQRDYFALQAVFAASDRVYPEKVREQRIRLLNNFLSELPVPEELKKDPRVTIRSEEREDLRLVHLREPMEIRVLDRGELGSAREGVEPGVPKVLRGKVSQDPFSDPFRRRAALANWLVQEDHPLTARVLVNRVWAWHFGAGLVRTPNDFGAAGEPPSHPELLDWLAREFMRHGWSLKHLHRLIMGSKTYRMSGRGSVEGARLDPENRLLWHFPRRRLEAEAVWDSMHACAGTLNRNQFGPPVFPPLTEEELSGLFGSDGKWPVTKEVKEHTRRGIYLAVRRLFPVPLFQAFDAPEVMVSCAGRYRTTVATQALALLNSRVAAAQARAFAERLIREGEGNRDTMVRTAWLLALSRMPDEAERREAESYLGAREAVLGREAKESGRSPFEQALTELCLALYNANEFVFVE